MMQKTRTSTINHAPTAKDRGAQVETTGGWREIKRGDEANLHESVYQVMYSKYYCHLCGIYIGPGHVEQEMYLWLGYDQEVYIAKHDEYFFFSGWKWLHICGGCATSPRRMLHHYFKVLFPQCWTTTLLLPDEDGGTPRLINTQDAQQMKRVLCAIHKHIRQEAPTYLLGLILASLLFSPHSDFSLSYQFWRACMEKATTPEEKKTRRKTATAAQSEQRPQQMAVIEETPAQNDNFRQFIAGMTDSSLKALVSPLMNTAWR